MPSVTAASVPAPSGEHHASPAAAEPREPPRTAERHRLRPGTPVIRRDAHRVQVGLTDPDAVILSGPAEAMTAFAELLDGRHTLGSAVRRSGLDADLAERTIHALAAVGLLARPAAAPPPRVKVVGLGQLGTLTAEHLHAHRIALWLADEEPADPDVHRDARVGATNAEAAIARMRAADPAPRPRSSTSPSPITPVVGHWAKPDDLRPDLTIVATDRPECDRLVPDALMRDDQPHLLVRGLGDGAVVGPLVHPGHSTCVRCCDLTRRDLDPEWPTVLAQLCRAPGHPPSTIAAWAAATAAAQAMAWLTGRRPETVGATLELREADWTTRLRRWPAHPLCGCGWH